MVKVDVVNHERHDCGDLYWIFEKVIWGEHPVATTLSMSAETKTKPALATLFILVYLVPLLLILFRRSCSNSSSTNILVMDLPWYCDM